MAHPISIDALRVLDAIARKGSFAAAAQELFRVPSAVSYTVQKLEEDLGIAVFDRTGHRAQLTPAGRFLLEEGRELLRAAEQLAHTTRRVAQGWETRLKIAVNTLLPVTAVFPAIEAFSQLNAPVEIQLTEEVFAGAWDSLQSHRADLLVGADPMTRPAGDYRTHLLGRAPFVYAIAPHHPLAEEGEPLSPDTISRYPAVVAADSSRHLQPGSAGIFARQPTLTVPNIDTKIAAQVAGLGVGWLPEHRIRGLVEEGRLVVREVESPRAPVELFLVSHAGDQGKALEWFWSYLTAENRFSQWLDPA